MLFCYWKLIWISDFKQKPDADLWSKSAMLSPGPTPPCCWTGTPKHSLHLTHGSRRCLTFHWHESGNLEAVICTATSAWSSPGWRRGAWAPEIAFGLLWQHQWCSPQLLLKKQHCPRLVIVSYEASINKMNRSERKRHTSKKRFWASSILQDVDFAQKPTGLHSSK